VTAAKIAQCWQGRNGSRDWWQQLQNG